MSKQESKPKPPDHRVVRYRREHDIVHGVTGSPGTKYTPLACLDDTSVRLVRVPNDEATKWFSDLERPTLKKAVAGLKRSGKRFGITKEATEFLKEIA